MQSLEIANQICSVLNTNISDDLFAKAFNLNLIETQLQLKTNELQKLLERIQNEHYKITKELEILDPKPKEIRDLDLLKEKKLQYASRIKEQEIPDVQLLEKKKQAVVTLYNAYRDKLNRYQALVKLPPDLNLARMKLELLRKQVVTKN
ncbi:hypothetical protein HDV06_005090 [Boothiomyces sp. JEL0866]|nr:hypothetical protein HDV06_005090 [Boothiomyces sp. JEL0866]